VAVWTVLLAWADRNPVERRAVLLLVAPIAASIGSSFAYWMSCGVHPGGMRFLIAGPAATALLFFAA
jgi:hypothetical protein